ncbi:UNVERIFIED_CONTAM: hypothetical protein HDU68_002499 [Siphonaria sp. JEL0065]|nr:hypothetical protein HDU68_002499 [Siphonaria sp. JEL0065]
MNEIQEVPILLQTHQTKIEATAVVPKAPLIVDLSNDVSAAAAEPFQQVQRQNDDIKIDESVPYAHLLKDEPKFKFTWLEKTKLSGFNDKDVQSLLFKWGMQDHCYLKRFGFDRKLNPYEIDEFILNLFNDGNVNGHLKVLGTMDRWGTLGRVTSVEKEETLHSVTSLTFFDRLSTTAGVVRPDGSIKKCIDEYCGSFIVADELRKCLLMEESETYPAFSESDRKEFVFHVFKAMCLGGKLCQYEDDIEPYLMATKKVYKDLITVTKDVSGKLAVSSLVFQIKSVESSVSPLFPIQHPQNFCYLSIDPIKRYVNVFYHASDVYY